MKTIGIAPAHKNQMGNYSSWLSKRGFKYQVLAIEDDASKYDMLLLTGGADIGQNLKRDSAEALWYKQMTNCKKPILGICRGLQLVNVLHDGTLIQDIEDTPSIKHTTDPISIANEGIRIDSSYHDVTIGSKTFKVNSRHHQGIQKLGHDLKAIGYSIDNLIEAVEGNNILLVQWHPERDEVYNTEAETFVLDWINEKLK